MFVQLTLISGLMFGIEYIFEAKFLVIDVGIVRVFIGLAPKGI